MEIVKTYQKVNTELQNINFGISKMEQIFERRSGIVDEPHRHNYYTILIISNAKGWHKIDFNTYELAKCQVFFVAPGQVHQVIEEEKSIGYAMTFSNQFLVQNSIPIDFIESLSLFQNYGQSPPLTPTKQQFNNIENFAENIFDLFYSQAMMKNLSIGSYLKLLLIECNNVCSINPIKTEIDTSGDNVLRTFKQIVNDNFSKEHSTTYYANHLNITPDHLNRTIKLRIGITAKDYIQARIITEAKRLLFFTDLSNKEIGYALGFNEPGNFSAFFKKHTQLSPSNFKKLEITA